MYYHDLKPIYNRLKNSAKKRGIPFDLSLGDLEELSIPLTCPILNIPLAFNTGRAQDNSVSYDRKDSTKGYTKDNLVVISWKANRLKNNASEEELRKISNFYSERKI